MANNPNTQMYQTFPEPHPVSPPSYGSQNEAPMPTSQGYSKQPEAYTCAPATGLGIPSPQSQQQQPTGETKAMPTPVSMPSAQQHQQPPTQQQAIPLSMPSVQQQSQFPTEQRVIPPPVSTQPQKIETEGPGFPQRQAPPQNYNAASVGQEYRDSLYAKCARGQHDRMKRYGTCGIITAILCFPCGLICLFADTQSHCARCGVSLD